MFKRNVNWCVSAALCVCASACGNSGDHAANGGAAGASSAGAPFAGEAGVSGATTAGASGSATLPGGGGAGGSSAGSASAGSAGSTLKGCVIPPEGSEPAAKLVDTGCVDPSDPRKPAPGAVSYELNSPLWSDSADKQRAFILPQGKKIHVRNCTTTPADCPQGNADDGRWDFPIGTVMIKIFLFDGKLVETRLLMHTSRTNDSPSGDWIGYGYQWNAAQTEATLVPSERVEVMFDTGTRVVPWHYPSRSDCLDCHTQQSGSSLGPETAQMNRLVGGMNQIDEFDALGLFESAPVMKTALPAPSDEAASLEQRARSYLHANCAFCHRPDGLYKRFDLRYDVALKDSKACNVDGIKGTVGNSSSINLLKPGAAAESLMWQRMNQVDPDEGRMPQIGTYAIDDAAQALVGQWIDQLPSTACTQ
ncbi:MAG TPA: hypothetical protein VHM25_28155 [Polyangiaceae bacterium]|nr:hypothetical protein [Polyangiaceae bacterium]